MRKKEVEIKSLKKIISFLNKNIEENIRTQQAPQEAFNMESIKSCLEEVIDKKIGSKVNQISDGVNYKSLLKEKDKAINEKDREIQRLK